MSSCPHVILSSCHPVLLSAWSLSACASWSLWACCLAASVLLISTIHHNRPGGGGEIYIFTIRSKWHRKSRHTNPFYSCQRLCYIIDHLVNDQGKGQIPSIVAPFVHIIGFLHPGTIFHLQYVSRRQFLLLFADIWSDKHKRNIRRITCSIRSLLLIS